MRILVCGGRDFNDRGRMWTIMSEYVTRATAVIHGAYRGADTLADEWARDHKIKPEPFPADWTRLRGRAGPIRNAKMLAEGKPDLVVAFPGGKGTADMVKKARAAGVPVRIV